MNLPSLKWPRLRAEFDVTNMTADSNPPFFGYVAAGEKTAIVRERRRRRACRVRRDDAPIRGHKTAPVASRDRVRHRSGRRRFFLTKGAACKRMHIPSCIGELRRPSGERLRVQERNNGRAIRRRAANVWNESSRHPATLQSA